MTREKWKDTLEGIGFVAIDEDRQRSVRKVMNLKNPRMKEFWLGSQVNFVPAYRDYVNQMIDEKNSQK